MQPAPNGKSVNPPSRSEHSAKQNWTVTRRDVLKASGLILAGYSGKPLSTAVDNNSPPTRMRFGIVTDTHYAKTDNRNDRAYNESAIKLEECVGLMNSKRVVFLAELGDFKDQDDPPVETNTVGYLKTIEGVFRKFKGSRYHVPGNHDVDSISKIAFSQIAKNTNIPARSLYYSFEHGNMHFIVLDANFKADGIDYDRGNFDWKDANIPHPELEWLKKDLASATKPVVAFVHQRLDSDDDYCVRNAVAVRHILQKNKNVLAVFQGHFHPGDYRKIEGIHYYTLMAMVEGTGDRNNAYAIVEVHEDFSMTVTGYRRAFSRILEKA